MPRIDKKYNFWHSLLIQRSVIVTLVIRDFRSRYLSSFVGLPWAFIQPASYVFIIWVAFTYGLRSGSTDSGVPFAPWLMTAIIPWMFISQTIIVSCMALPEYAYLIKKTHFNVGLIPVVKVLSGMIVHVIMVGIIALLLIFYFGMHPTVYWLQIFYYLFATFLLLTGIAWFVSSVNIFIQDMGHIVQIVTSMLFWATPIVWPFTMLHGNMKYIALLNPFFYITEGYRYTFIEEQWFFNFPEMNIFFWSVTAGIILLGVFTFKKLKPDFGDVL